MGQEDFLSSEHFYQYFLWLATALFRATIHIKISIPISPTHPWSEDEANVALLLQDILAQVKNQGFIVTNHQNNCCYKAIEARFSTVQSLSWLFRKQNTSP